jgi:hypothetical protein
MAHRLCAQLLYTVVTVYLSGQWVIFYIARYTSKPTKLYWECLLHALRHMYGHRHIGLTLGGVGERRNCKRRCIRDHRTMTRGCGQARMWTLAMQRMAH